MKNFFACVLTSFFIFIWSLLITSTVFAAGPTVINTEISQNTIWSASSSPYVLSGGIIVNRGVTLTIDPGTVVKFEQDSTLIINGTLSAKGVAGAPLYFTSNADDAVGGDTNQDDSASLPSASNRWSLLFLNAGSSTIENAIIRYSNGGFFLSNSALSIASSSFSVMNGQLALGQSTLTLQDISFNNMNHGAVSVFSTSTVILTNVTIQNSLTDAVAVYDHSMLHANRLIVDGEARGAGLDIFNSSQASCDQCVFSNINNNIGPSVTVFSSSVLELTNSSIKSAEGEAVAFEIFDTPWQATPAIHSQAVLSNTTLDGGEIGIIAFGSSTLAMASTTIQNFSDHGILAYNGPALFIQGATVSKNTIGIEIYGLVGGAMSQSAVTDNTQSGIISRTSSPFIAIENWWGTLTGPYNSLNNLGGTGNEVSGNVEFSPWLSHWPILKSDPPIATVCCSNIIFLPGIEASRLYATTSNILGAFGGTAENQLWEPGLTTNINTLFLDLTGKSIYPVYTKDIIKKTNEVAWNVDIYQDFCTMLDGLVASGTINTWQGYPYDWRLDPQFLLENGTQVASFLEKLEPTVETLAAQSKTKKVTLIAHSNGGILAKLLISKLQSEGKNDLIDKTILIAVPQLGTPAAIPGLLSGYGQGLGSGFILSETAAQHLAQNMPAAYNLLPSPAYFNSTAPVVFFDPSLDAISNLRMVYGSSINEYSKLANFLTGSVDQRSNSEALLALANSTLVSRAKDLHATLDSWQMPPDMQLIQIAGIGVPTLSSSSYYAKEPPYLGVIKLPPMLDMRPQFTLLGDGAVIATSALAITTNSFYINLAEYNSINNSNRSHADILEVKPVQQLLSNIIKGMATSTPLSLPQFVSVATTATLPAFNSQDTTEQISIHSPVDLDVYDEYNRHTGRMAVDIGSSSVQRIQTQIPNSYYLPFGEGQYVGIPAETKGKIVLSGEALGTFTLDITAQGTTTEFSNIPILPVSTALVILNKATSTLDIDYDGDGLIDETISPESSFKPSIFLIVLKKLTMVFALPVGTKKYLAKKIEKMIEKESEGNLAKLQKYLITQLYPLSIFKDTKESGRSISLKDQQTLLAIIDNYRE